MRLKELTIGLYHPAVLGTSFVLLLVRLFMHGSLRPALLDPAMQFGSILLVLLSASFLATTDLPREKYGWKAFLLDSIESVLVFGAFNALGLFEVARIVTPDMKWTYWFVSLLLVETQLWSFLEDGSSRSRKVWPFRLVVTVGLFVAGLFSPLDELWSIVVAFFFALMVFWYLGSFGKPRRA